jgi:predicted  nucleic acid-binding Zn-ribbon protein
MDWKLGIAGFLLFTTMGYFFRWLGQRRSAIGQASGHSDVAAAAGGVSVLVPMTAAIGDLAGDAVSGASGRAEGAAGAASIAASVAEPASEALSGKGDKVADAEGVADVSGNVSVPESDAVSLDAVEAATGVASVAEGVGAVVGEVDPSSRDKFEVGDDALGVADGVSERASAAVVGARDPIADAAGTTPGDIAHRVSELAGSSVSATLDEVQDAVGMAGAADGAEAPVSDAKSSSLAKIADAVGSASLDDGASTQVGAGGSEATVTVEEAVAAAMIAESRSEPASDAVSGTVDKVEEAASLAGVADAVSQVAGDAAPDRLDETVAPAADAVASAAVVAKEVGTDSLNLVKDSGAGAATMAAVAAMPSAKAVAELKAAAAARRSPRIVVDPRDVRPAGSSWWWVAPGLLALGCIGFMVLKSVNDNLAGWSWQLWSLLGLGGLLSLVGLLTMLRRHPLVDEKRGAARGLGFVTMLSGLLLGLASMFAWQPKIAGLADFDRKLSATKASLVELQGEKRKIETELQAAAADRSEIGRLKGVIDGLNGDLGKLKTANAGLSGDLGKLKAANDGLSNDLGKLKAGNADLAASNGGLKAQVAELAAKLAAAGSSGADSAELDKLRAANAELTAELGKLKTSSSALVGDNRKLSDEVAALGGRLKTAGNGSEEIGRLNGVIAGLTKDSAAQTGEIQRLKAALDGAASEGKARDGRLAGLAADIAARDARIKQLEAALAERAAPAAAPAAAAAKVAPSVAQLRLQGSNYAVEPLAPNLIGGQAGSFYRVRLKEPGGRDYKFATGSYFNVVPAAPFRQTVSAAIADIEKSLAGRRYQLYALGSASAGSFTGRREKGYQYKRVRVLTKGPDGSYGSSLETRQFSDPIHNEDLPNLRGAFMQEYIGRYYKIGRPIVLDGAVSTSKDEAEQSVALILHVED